LRGCLSARGLLIRALCVYASDQRQQKNFHDAGRIMQITYWRIQIQSHRATAPGTLIAIGTKHPFANGYRQSTHAFLVNEAMGYQLLGLLAVEASLVLKL